MKISVIIPVYNTAAFIAGCIDSVLAQEEKPAEIICVDDASQDESAAIVESYVRQYPGLVQLIRMETNGGGSRARNKGLAVATGDYLQFLDADDFLLPQKLKHQVQLIAASKRKPDFISAAYKRISLKGKEYAVGILTSDPWESLLNGRLGITSSNLWKREAVVSAGGFDETLKSSQEYGLMFGLLKNGGEVLYDGLPLTMVRDQPPGQSVSRKDPPKNWERYILMRVKTLQYLEEHGLLKENNRNRYYQPLFEAIRILYNFSPERAKALYGEHIPPGFVPRASAAVTPGYVKLFRIFGFPGTERLRTIVRLFKGRVRE